MAGKASADKGEIKACEPKLPRLERLANGLNLVLRAVGEERAGEQMSANRARFSNRSVILTIPAFLLRAAWNRGGFGVVF